MFSLFFISFSIDICEGVYGAGGECCLLSGDKKSLGCPNASPQAC